MKPFLTPAFVGRQEELGQLDAALAAVQTGAGQCVLVSGEAGIGKSRLIAELHQHARENGFATLSGRCFEEDRAFPYAPLLQIVRALSMAAAGSDLPVAVSSLLQMEAAGAPSQSASPSAALFEKRQLFTALTALFAAAAESAPVLVVVEDLHWGDDATLEFLLYLARRLSEQRILLLLSARPAASAPALSALLAGLDREPNSSEIRLAPLARADVAELLRAMLAQPQPVSAEFVAAIHALTEGNPFFAEEICSSLIASGDLYYANDHWRRKPLSQLDIPDSIQRLIQPRLERLSSAARQLIELAAVSGRTFDFNVLQHLTGQEEAVILDLVKEAMAAKLVVEESANRFAFRHALTREALYGRLLARERQMLHRQLAEAIEQVYGDTLPAQLQVLAYHTFAAGLWRKAVRYGREAGEKALAVHAPGAALAHFTRAIEAAGHLEEAPAAALYRLRGQAFDTLGAFAEAQADYELALEVARGGSDQQLVWELLLDLALLWAARDYERTGDYCRQALALARSLEAPEAIAHSLNRLGNCLMNQGQPVEALDYHREALALFESLEDQAGIAASLDLLAMTSNQCGNAADTVAYYRRAIPLLRQLDDVRTLSSSLTMLSNYTLDESQAREAVALAREAEWRSGEAYALVYLGSLLAYSGSCGEGVRYAQEGLALANTIDHRLWQAWAEIVLGLIYLELFALDEASRQLESALDLAQEVGASFMVTAAAGSLASVYVAQQRFDEAAALLPREVGGSPNVVNLFYLRAAMELALVREEPKVALRLYRQSPLPEREHWLGAMTYFYASILRLRGEGMRQLGQLAEAEASVREGLESCRQQGVVMGVWRLQQVLVEVYQAGSAFEKAAVARAAAERALAEWASTVPEDLRGGFEEKARVLIRPAESLTPRQAKKRQYGGLTRREREVAQIVARGLTNQEIADELVVSIKTVEAHVSHILSKLGFSSRAQIAAWAVDRGLAEAPQDLNTLSAEG